MTATGYLIELSDSRALDSGLVGRKFSSLARAHQSGLAVPEAVCLSSAAHNHFLDTGEWPQALFESLRKRVDPMLLSTGVSVRSSGILEDLEGSSFAGQYESYLHVRRPAALKEKVEQCWQSGATERIKSYLKARGYEQDRAPMGVILQRMVPAKFSGVAFSRDPRTGAAYAVIEAAEGGGDVLVGGEITPHRALVTAEGGFRLERVSRGHRAPVDEQWQRVASLAREVDQSLIKGPADLEWAIDEDNTLWLLQARPVTGMRPEPLEVPQGTWTRSIADDLWSDRLTPFLADFMLANSHRFDLTRPARRLGLNVRRPTLSVIDGYLYVNCHSLADVIVTVPERLRSRQLKGLFPGEMAAALPEWRPGRLVRALSGALRLLVVEPGANPVSCRWITRRRVKARQQELERIRALPMDSSEQALQKVDRCLELFASLQETNQWPYMWAALLTWTLHWMVVEKANRPHHDFLSLISSPGRNVSATIEHEFRSLAERIGSRPELTETLQRVGPEQGLGSLPRPVHEALQDFLDSYGCRARHRTLVVPRWEERPSEVLAMILGLVQKGSGDGKTRVKEPVGVRLWWAKPVMVLTRRYLDLREDLRFQLDKVLCELRRSLLVLGEQTGLKDTVFFLSREELEDAISGGSPSADLAELAENRQKTFDLDTTPPDHWIDGLPETKDGEDTSRISGVGTSPGRARGRARLVSDPATADIGSGEILVARNTDPGWTPVLSNVSGIVTEVGGLLNHCSIVARELGIPAVVGVRSAMSRISTGDLVEVDGSGGTVTIIEPEGKKGEEE